MPSHERVARQVQTHPRELRLKCACAVAGQAGYQKHLSTLSKGAKEYDGLQVVASVVQSGESRALKPRLDNHPLTQPRPGLTSMLH